MLGKSFEAWGYIFSFNLSSIKRQRLTNQRSTINYEKATETKKSSHTQMANLKRKKKKKRD